MTAEDDWREAWESFIARARQRMERGAEEYGNQSFGADPDELVNEIEEELLDVVNWATILGIRLRRLEGRIEARLMESVGEDT